MYQTAELEPGSGSVSMEVRTQSSCSVKLCCQVDPSEAGEPGSGVSKVDTGYSSTGAGLSSAGVTGDLTGVGGVATPGDSGVAATTSTTDTTAGVGSNGNGLNIVLLIFVSRFRCWPLRPPPSRARPGC